MSKNLGYSKDDFTVEMFLLKDLVNISPVAVHLLGKPFDCSALFVENRFDNMSYMEIRHLLCIKNIVNFCLRWRF